MNISGWNMKGRRMSDGGGPDREARHVYSWENPDVDTPGRFMCHVSPGDACHVSSGMGPYNAPLFNLPILP